VLYKLHRLAVRFIADSLFDAFPINSISFDVGLFNSGHDFIKIS